MSVVSPRRRRATSRTLWAVSALCLAFAAATAITAPANASTNGSDWGPQGTTTTDSATTVSWDNSGNSAADTVPRDANQILPYTGGKTYADTDATMRAGAQSAFGNLKLTVSQTVNLRHQGVTVSYTGVNGAGAGRPTLDVFQCWGGTTVDGKTDTDNPDPTHCQTGAGGIDSSVAHNTVGRGVGGIDQLLMRAGDLKALTFVTVSGSQTGTVGTLTATVRTGHTANPGIVTGAAGTVEFDRVDGTVVQKGVPVATTGPLAGTATVQVPGMAATGTGFTAKYLAAPSENYQSSEPSSSLSLPPSWDLGGDNRVPAGSLNTVLFPAGSFAPGDQITTALDGGGPVSAGGADAFGGVTLAYTVPPALIADGTAHSLTIAGASLPVKKFTVQFTVPTPPTGTVTGTGTNQPNRTSSFPFVPVDGSTVGEHNSLFSLATTNEFTDFQAAATPTGTASRTFDLQTGAEAPGLGCGYRADQASTNTCWIVAVPRGYTGDPGPAAGESVLSPSVWAQRVQVKLSFQEVAQSCPNGQARTLAAGTELLSAALASWVPAICASQQVALGYATVGDPQARDQYSAGGQSLVFTSKPIDDSGGTSATVYAPVGLTGVTVAYRMWDNRKGQAITGIRLNARLVAKLLTESYYWGVDMAFGTQIGSKAPWVSSQILNLSSDPEFQTLNPGLPYNDIEGYGDIVVSSTLSDAVDLLWQWIVHDHDGRAFLDGCPDGASNDSVINPFYSTRSYSECSDQKAQLEASAAAKRAATVTPSTYQDGAPSYPPTGGAYPQPGWYERDPDATLHTLPLTLADMHPREATLAGVGVDVFHGLERSNTSWCYASVDLSCTSGPGTFGKWTSLSAPALASTVLGVTGAPIAGTYQVATAQLCDDAANCVGANTASLVTSSGAFIAATGSPVLQSPASSDIKGGAYPLTLPIYAEVNTKGLLAADAKAIAKVLGFMTTTGQNPGFAPGSLPPGYAPLPSKLVAQAATTIATLNAITDTAPASVPIGATANNGISPLAQMVPVTSSTSATGDQGAVANPKAIAEVGTTPTTSVGFPQFGLVTGLGGALVAGIAAPVVGRKRKEQA